MVALLDEPSLEHLGFNPPAIPSPILARVLGNKFGIGGSLRSLAGERDQNLRVLAEDGKTYVLKVSGPGESLEQVEFQVRALEHIARMDPGLPVPKHIPTVDGQFMTPVINEEGECHQARLLTFVEGTPIETFPPPSARQIHEIGALGGRLCLALRGFDHPAATRFMPWDLMNGLIVLETFRARYFPAELADACAPHFERLERCSLPRMAALPVQVIHNDAHLGNLLSDLRTADSVTGVIDFGDMVKRPMVVDLAVVLGSLIETSADVIGCARQLLQGYQRYVEIPDEQLELLFDAVFARSALTVQLLSFRLQKSGDNAAKNKISLLPAMRVLQTLLSLDRERFISEIMRQR